MKEEKDGWWASGRGELCGRGCVLVGKEKSVLKHLEHIITLTCWVSN